MGRKRTVWDREKLLRIAIAKEPGWGGFWVHRYKWGQDQLRRCVKRAVKAGHLRRVQRRRDEDIYVATDAGRDWLEQQGGTP